MLDREIAEFGRRMGLPQLALPESGVAALDVDKLGRLYLERGQDTQELLVYLAFPVPAHDSMVLRRALELCSYAHAHPWPLSAGVHAGQLVLLVRLHEREVTAASLENAIHFLSQVLERVL
ncbi:MAG: type III secretion chaperone SycN [Desulfomicrobium sp.]|jgi:type III secretion system chaperone SycN|nr:type III secretion chaperone SycN [Desulfomicrobium sp.]NLV97842.1 type III secretion chaperone SycN [Desulfovibrionales bacterium]